MKKFIYINIATLTALCVVLATAYIVLLQDNCLNTSISSILARSHHLEYKQHCIVLGLLPIYIAMVIFGSALFGLYLGSRMKHFLGKSS